MKNVTFLFSLTLALGLTATVMAQPGGQEGPGRRGGQERMDPARMMQMFPLMKALDANSDGKLSKKEVENATNALWKLDKNDDGVIDMAELRPQRGGERGGPERPRGGAEGMSERAAAFMNRIMESDKNDDGKLSQDELPERMQRGFARLDQNEDGYLDRKELEAMMQRMGRGGQGGRGGQAGRGGEGGRGGEAGQGGRGGRGGEGGRGGRGGEGGQRGGDGARR